jgi:hypothetical protein
VTDARSVDFARPTVPVGTRGQLALAIAAAVDTTSGSHRVYGALSSGTQYPGGRVDGIDVASHEVAVHIVAERLPLHDVVDAVRSAAEIVLDAQGDRRPVRIVVDDLDLGQLPVIS